MTGTQGGKKCDYQMSYSFKERQQKVLKTRLFLLNTIFVANIVTNDQPHAMIRVSFDDSVVTRQAHLLSSRVRLQWSLALHKVM